MAKRITSYPDWANEKNKALWHQQHAETTNQLANQIGDWWE